MEESLKIITYRQDGFGRVVVGELDGKRVMILATKTHCTVTVEGVYVPYGCMEYANAIQYMPKETALESII